MKTNMKAFQLIEKGLSAKTVSKLTESQVNILHKKLFNDLLTEQVKQEKKQITKTTIPAATAKSTGANVDGVSIKVDASGNVVASTSEGEMSEQSGVEVDKDNASSGEYTQDMPQKSAPDGMDDDLDNPNEKNAVGTVESIKEDKKNPWAICTAQLGKEFGTRERHLWSAKEKNKYERCVKDVKQSLKEGKNPVSLFIENQIMKIVERNLPPKITKGDLIKYLAEAGPATAPSKPKTSPTTKPGKPATKPRPSHPGKNPNPGEKEAPKAKNVSPDKAKDEVIDVIMNLLQK